MLEHDRRDEMVAKIESVRSEVVQSVIEDIYSNPFWSHRYGERGEKQSNKDASYNLNYLQSAIRMDTPNALSEYYRWLRGALVYRGMCTLHLVETLDSTARHLARLLPGEWPAIQPYHQAGYEGLAYRHPAAAALHQIAGQVALSATNRMFDSARTGLPANEKKRNACLRDNLYHLSYLADAVELEKTELFFHYLHWVSGFLAQFGVQAEMVYEDLRIIREEISESLPEGHAAPVMVLLETLVLK